MSHCDDSFRQRFIVFQSRSANLKVLCFRMNREVQTNAEPFTPTDNTTVNSTYKLLKTEGENCDWFNDDCHR